MTSFRVDHIETQKVFPVLCDGHPWLVIMTQKSGREFLWGRYASKRNAQSAAREFASREHRYDILQEVVRGTKAQFIADVLVSGPAAPLTEALSDEALQSMTREIVAVRQMEKEMHSVAMRRQNVKLKKLPQRTEQRTRAAEASVEALTLERDRLQNIISSISQSGSAEDAPSGSEPSAAGEP
jgi:hypothetical protein